LGLPIFDHEDDEDPSYRERQRERRRQTRSSSPQKLKETSGRKKQSSKSSNKKERYKSSRSHSPVGRNKSGNTTTSSSQRRRSTKSGNRSEQRPKSESSLDASKKSESQISIDFQDDTDIGTAAGKKKQKRRGRKPSSNQEPEMTQAEMENELAQMLGSMNGSKDFHTGPLKTGDDAVTLDTTTNSKASTKSKKKKRRGSKSTSATNTPESPGKKSVRITNGQQMGDAPLASTNGSSSTKPPRRTKSTKSSKSVTSNKSKKKSKKSSKDDAEQAPPRKSRRPPKPPGGDGEKTPTDSEAKKKKKKSRRPSKSPTPGGLAAASNHTKGSKSTRQNSKRDVSSKSARSVTQSSKSARSVTQKTGTNGGTVKRSQSLDPGPSPGNLRRAKSDRQNPAGGSARSAPGGNRLRRARSLFGSVLNPNAKGAETVGDGDNSDNEYEVKQTRDNSGGANSGKGILGWAKKKMHQNPASPKKSPGTFLKKRGLRVGGRSGRSGEDDHHGLLSNAEDRGGQMSLLDLMVHSPDDDKAQKEKGGLEMVGEDNTIEESNEFHMPHLTATTNSNVIHNKFEAPRNNRASMASEANTLRNSAVIDANRPPFSQIIATGDHGVEEDDMSDIGDPESNMVVPEGIEPEEPISGEIIMNPDRNDVLYEVKAHPGTVRMLHVLREILVEHQDDIEYSPEVYKVIKRRLKGRKFLLRTMANGQPAWREANKSENVRLLKDFFNDEMRQLGFGGADELEESDRRPGNKKRRNSHASMGDGSIRGNLLQKAIAECKWAQEVAKPNGDIDMMNIGIDSEEKLISLIEIADAGGPRTEELKEELDNLGELAKQMMYVSIAPLYERLEEIEERMADYFDQENAILDAMDNESKDYGSRGSSIRDRSMEKEGELYEIAMKNASSEDENFFDDDEDDEEEVVEEEYEEEEYEEEEEDPLPEEYDDESDGASGTNVKEGEVLNCETTDGDVSSVGESGIYDESESEDDESELEDGEAPEGVEYEEEDYTESDEDSQSYDASNHSSDDDESDVSDAPKLKRKKSIFEEPNPKMKQFFDRLNHFFETRKRIEECAASKDPGNKCRKIKAKTSSGGIEKKNGGFKKECQQRNTSNKVIRNLDELYDSAKAVYPDFKSIVQQLVDEISGLDYKKNILLPELKPRGKAYEKAATEYIDRDLGPPESWLYDICRAGIVCNTVKQVSEISKWLTSNSNVIQAKNRFADPVFNGYRDLLYHISVPYGDGRSHICEVQVHLKAIYDLNVQCGTIKHYESFRKSFSNQWRSQEDALSDLAKMNKYTKIEGPFMKRLLKSEDPEQLLLFAEILRNELEEYERALEIYRRVLGLQEEAHGADNPEMAATYQSIGLVLGAMGDTDESLQNLLKALAIQESFLGADHADVADSYVEIGHMLSKRGDYSGAYTQYQRTMLIRENKLGKEHFTVINSIQDIGLVLQKKGDFEDSEKEYRKALAIQRGVLGDDHMDVATSHSLIGRTLCLYGDFEKAMVEEKVALSMREKSLGKNHVSTADSHTAIGVLLFQKGDYKTSRWHHNKALKIRESMLGKGDGVCAVSHSHLGELLSYAEGDYEGAVKALKRGQEILEANVGMDNPVTASSYLDLGHIHLRHGKHQEALAEYRRAKVILESNLGQTHPETAATYLCTGNALNLAGEQDEALQMHRKALVVLQSVLGNSHPRTADGYQSTGDVFVASGNPELALPEHREALKIRKSVLRKDHPAIAESCSRIGKILLTGCDSNGNTKKRDPKGALDIFREALAITEARCGKDHPASAVARLDVSLALMELKLMDEAEAHLKSAVEVLRQVEPLEGKKPTKSFYLGFGDAAAITGKACVSLGTVWEQKGNSDGAREMFVEGLERLIAKLGGDHPETLKVESKLLSFVAES